VLNDWYISFTLFLDFAQRALERFCELRERESEEKQKHHHDHGVDEELSGAMLLLIAKPCNLRY